MQRAPNLSPVYVCDDGALAHVLVFRAGKAPCGQGVPVAITPQILGVPDQGHWSTVEPCTHVVEN